MSSPITVDEALALVLSTVEPLGTEIVPISSALSRVLAADLYATENFPPFEASIMDGYAVRGSLTAGVYPIQESVLAGEVPSGPLPAHKVVYITTGAMLPEGANAVIRVEDTERVEGDKVHIKVDVAEGAQIRKIGSDIARGELVLRKGDTIGPAEIGLLITIGKIEVLCWRKPVIGVMSTGSELVQPWETPIGSQIRDSNRACLIAALQEDHHQVVDLGIVSDSREETKLCLIEAAARCNVVITSGGVSMGVADFVKPLLKELGTVHFEKLKMKPGKPTTFATIRHPTEGIIGSKQTLFFGLPGNPVSCLVTKTLFVDPAIKRLQGLDSEACLTAEVSVKVKGSDIKLDAERPEYHRVLVEYDSVDGTLYAESTGFQRSSRLMSMKSANALLFLPKGPGTITVGSTVSALLTRPLGPVSYKHSVHPKSASLDFLEEKGKETNGGPLSSFDTMLKNDSNKEPEEVPKPAVVLSPATSSDWTIIRTGLLTISDRASSGVYADESGPTMCKLLMEMSNSDWPLKIVIVASAIVPDEPAMIQSVVTQWTDPESPMRVDFLLTSGGTGFGLRDTTPEAVSPLLHRHAPGIAQALLNEGLKHTPLAVLSRPIAGTRFKTFLCTLPGSVKAIKENIVCLKPLLPRIFELLKEGSCQGKH